MMPSKEANSSPKVPINHVIMRQMMLQGENLHLAMTGLAVADNAVQSGVETTKSHRNRPTAMFNKRMLGQTSPKGETGFNSSK